MFNFAFINLILSPAKRFLDPRSALEDFNKVLSVQPERVFALQRRGEIKRMLGDYKGALEDLNRCCNLGEPDAFTLQSLGSVKRSLGDLQGSLDAFNRAAELQPTSWYILRGRGLTKMELEDDAGALEDLARANQLEPNDKATLHQMGIALYNMKMFTEAINVLTKALQTNGSEEGDVEIYKFRGLSFAQLKQYEQAFHDLDISHHIDSSDVFVLLTCGGLKRMCDRKEEALEDFTLALQIEPNNIEALQRIGMFIIYLVSRVNKFPPFLHTGSSEKFPLKISPQNSSNHALNYYRRS
jgi:tetratricopeptide (TPR) repeat protein